MADIDLDKMSREELAQLRRSLDKAIRTFEDRQRKEALAAAEAAAQERGFSLGELIDGKTRQPRRSRPPKYRHPENPALTWSGRGRQPAWYKEMIEAGRREEDLLIAS